MEKSSTDNNAYVGCFIDTVSQRLFPHQYLLSRYHPDTENNMCLLYCKEKGYMYSGTQYGFECYCGDDPYQHCPDKYVQDYDCDMECYGDSGQMCGGFWRMSVYKTGSNDYVGCFIDTPTRLFPYKYLLNNGSHPPDMENNMCLLHCKEQGYIYSGKQNYEECWCGDDPYWYCPENVDDYYKEPRYNCDRECLADSQQICGEDGEYQYIKQIMRLNREKTF
ncbi:sialate:O-sulfotransferase 1-like [Mytilus edulis]|uniref:sialate:O-sulfotransferase 1-like n=1 Tax=Mytilus edulis TaxID=6550 RepID=UPI0039EF4851